MFGAPAAAPSTPAFGTPVAAPSTPTFGTPAANPFGTPAAAPSTPNPFGTPAAASSTPNPFGTPAAASSTPNPFGTPAANPFGTPAANPSPPLFGTPAANSSTPLFGTPAVNPFGTPAANPFATPAANPSTPAFGTPAAAPTTPTFGTPGASLFSTPQAPAQPSLFSVPQLTPQPSPFSFAPPPASNQIVPAAAAAAAIPSHVIYVNRDVQAIYDAFRNEPTNPSFAFRHLLFSVTDPVARGKPMGVSDIMWAEAMRKLEAMESSDRERLWPELVLGFKDLSKRLKLQDEAMFSDAERLSVAQTNVKLLQQNLQARVIPWIQRVKQKEQVLQRRLLRVMRILEALEGKGYRIPLTKAEVESAEKLATLAKQLKGSGADLGRRVNNLLAFTRMRANSGAIGNSVYLRESARIDEDSLFDMQEVLQLQTEAISRLGNVLKRDVRNLEIIVSEDTEMTENGGVSY